MRAVVSAVIALVAFGLVAACGTNPPQIVDYSPQRGTIDVATSIPIGISFDVDVDKSSVEGRLHTNPSSIGHIVWLNNRSLSYVHQPFTPSTEYEAILEPGYKATTGDVYQLRHHWQFTTEGPPAMSGSVPVPGEGGVDPAAYVVLNFTRDMDQSSIASATSIVPATAFSIRLDANDHRHVIVAPNSLLRPNSEYRVTVTTDALDIDGNHIDRAQTFNFTTGAARPLRHWIAFIADDGTGISSAVWIVDESRIPRQLFSDAPVVSFSWSPEGQRLMLHRVDGGWTVLQVGGGATELGFNARWAAALGPGLGYAYLDSSGTLRRLGLDGTDEEVARGVTEAAVAPGGDRIAFVVPTSLTGGIWGYDSGLHSSYHLTSDAGVLTNLAWAPAGNRIAYLLDDGAGSHLKVLTLGATSTRTTVASGDLGPPAWLPDSNHLVFSATVDTPAGTIHKAFLISTSSPPSALTLSLGLPAVNTVDVVNPVPSPDGHQIAFVNQAGDYPELWLMNADGTDPAALTRFDTSEFPYASTSPAWTRA